MNSVALPSSDPVALQAQCLLDDVADQAHHKGAVLSSQERLNDALAQAPSVEIVRWLLNRGADPNSIDCVDLMNPEGRWRRIRHTEVLKALYEAGRDPNRLTWRPTCFADLSSAVALSCPSAIKTIIHYGGRSDMVPDLQPDARTPWAEAMTRGRWGMAALLLPAGVHWGEHADEDILKSLAQVTSSETTPAVVHKIWSAVAQHPSWKGPQIQAWVAEHLPLRDPAEPPVAQAFWAAVLGDPCIHPAPTPRPPTNNRPSGPNRGTEHAHPIALHNTNGALRSVEKLVEARSLSRAAQTSGLAAVRAVLAAGVPPDEERDNRDNTVLMQCSEEGDLPKCAVLLRAGADPNARNNQGYTPLMLYLMHGCVMTTMMGKPSTLIEGLRVFVPLSDLSCTTRVATGGQASGSTLLHCVVGRNMPTQHMSVALAFLLENGVDPRITDDVGRTPLDYLRFLSSTQPRTTNVPEELLQQAMLAWDRDEIQQHMRQAPSASTKTRRVM